jgi:hypothetical protein
LAIGDKLFVADKPTLDSVNAKVGATGDAANASGSIFARLAELLTNRLTAARAAFLDAAISSRAPSGTALSTATWTAARAGYLDELTKLMGDTIRSVDYYNGSPVANTWYTVCNISGAGVLARAGVGSSSTSLYAGKQKLRITIDGVVALLDGPTLGTTPYSRGFTEGRNMMYFGPVRFNTNLLVEILAAEAYLIGGSADYTLF